MSHAATVGRRKAGVDPSAPDIAARFSVSRETAERLLVYVRELRRWQSVRNLVGKSTIDDIWGRHVADSLQLADLAEGEIWVDLGSGAGLPGLLLALVKPDIRVHLIESDGRKCAFLREAARLTGAGVTVWDARIEAALPKIVPAPQVVVSRALAALPKLLELSQSLLTNGAVALFPKGRGYEAELTDSRRSWTFDCDILPSRTDLDGRILRIKELAGRRPAASQIGDPS